MQHPDTPPSLAETMASLIDDELPMSAELGRVLVSQPVLLAPDVTGQPVSTRDDVQ